MLSLEKEFLCCNASTSFELPHRPGISQDCLDFPLSPHPLSPTPYMEPSWTFSTMSSENLLPYFQTIYCVAVPRLCFQYSSHPWLLVPLGLLASHIPIKYFHVALSQFDDHCFFRTHLSDYISSLEQSSSLPETIRFHFCHFVVEYVSIISFFLILKKKHQKATYYCFPYGEMHGVFYHFFFFNTMSLLNTNLDASSLGLLGLLVTGLLH